jgi:polysaccharide export outer membrane protein
MALAMALPACQGTLRSLPAHDQLETEAMEASREYRIGPTDVLQISVWRNPELSVPEVVVRPDGKISFPLLDDVQAAGLTPSELKDILTTRLAEYITAPNVTVVVRQINSKVVYVIGEVNRQGTFPLNVDMRVIDALAVAGGFGPFADRSRVTIIRNRNGKGPIEFRFNYDEFVDGQNLGQNLLLLPGDKIVVP